MDMRNQFLIFVFVLFSVPSVLNAQDIAMIKSGDLNFWRTQNSDTVYIINFWATWCKPCVAELPDLEKVNSDYAGKKVKVILISNDFKKQLQTRVKPFIADKGIRSTVLFMDESDPNSWIEKVSLDWGGAIPATWIIQKSKNFESFHEGVISFEQLKKIIDPLIN